MGDPWAGQCNDIDKLCFLVIPVISVSEENFGADPPMGSKKMHFVEKQYIYLKLGVGVPWAGQVSENGEDCFASDVMILETIVRNNIGTFTNGPFNPREDPIGAMINFVGCAPGNEETVSMAHNFI